MFSANVNLPHLPYATFATLKFSQKTAFLGTIPDTLTVLKCSAQYGKLLSLICGKLHIRHELVTATWGFAKIYGKVRSHGKVPSCT